MIGNPIMIGRKPPVLTDLNVTLNGVYEVPEGTDGYSSVVVNVLTDAFPNGSEWTVSNKSSGRYSVIKYANGMWIACGGLGGSAGIYYSTDGKKWSIDLTNTNITDTIFYDVNNANGLWIATGASGIYYSTNGMNWTQSSDTRAYCSYNACGIWTVGTSAGIYYSTNGTSWTLSDMTASCNNICYGNGVWVSCENNKVWYSTNAINWTLSNITSEYCDTIWYANGIWNFSSPNASGIYYSTNGKSWVKSLEYGFDYIYCGENGLWIACSEFTSKGLWYSTDGINWTQSSLTEAVNFAHYASGIWIASSGADKGLYYSADGINFKSTNITSGNFVGVNNADGIWVAGSMSNGGLYYSVTWESV